MTKKIIVEIKTVIHLALSIGKGKESIVTK